MRQICFVGVAVHIWTGMAVENLILDVLYFVFSLVFVSKFNHQWQILKQSQAIMRIPPPPTVKTPDVLKAPLPVTMVFRKEVKPPSQTDTPSYSSKSRARIKWASPMIACESR